MKRLSMMIIALVFAVAAVCSSYSETHTIVLVSVVQESQPEFTIRSIETGRVGNMVSYRTSDISKMDVSSSFQIIQTNHSNYRGIITFDVQATELVAYRYGSVYSTDGVSIMMDGRTFGDEAVMVLNYDHNVREGSGIASFMVKWPTDPGLIEATYEAAIFLNYTVS